MRFFIFLAVSIPLVLVSRKTLRQPRAHGFHRFFAWEAILVIIVLNAPEIPRHPLSPLHLLSWLCFSLSMYLLCHSLCLLNLLGRPTQQRNDATLFAFERTSTLVTCGTFKYIRHPMYASLLLLLLAAFMQRPTWNGSLLAFLSIYFVHKTAIQDEVECLQYFGRPYADYMKQTKRFVPLLY